MNTRWLNPGLHLICVLALLVLNMPVAASPSSPPEIAAAAQTVVGAVVAPAAPSSASYVPGEVLVRFAPAVGLKLAQRAPDKAATTGVASLDRLGAEYGLRAAEPVFRQAAQQKAQRARAGLPPQADFGDVYRLTFPADVDVAQVVAAYTADPYVVYAEPNYFFEFDGAPNDPYFGQQWYLHNTGQYHLDGADIDAPQAWDIVTGTETVVIAVIDTGVDRDHPDLTDRLWANPGETPGDGVDNDGNGYTDDTWGWNWVSDGSDPDDYEFNDPRDDNGHGTHVAGIAAAATDNGVGVAGVCWNCRVMALKAFESNGVGTTSDIVQAIAYAAGKGADVINMSFGTYAESLLLEDTLAAAYGQAVLVAAAGNYGKTRYATTPYYPASYPYVLGVGATDVGCVQHDPLTLLCTLWDEIRADFSNYGVNADVGAPGVSIYSTFPGGGYASLSGTSMAAPIVSGLAALLLSQHPTWSKEMARGQIIQTADAIYTGEFGRVNAQSAVTFVPVPDVTLLSDSLLYGDAGGDADGIPDAGETFSVTLALKNTWGAAQGTTAVLSTSDPYVTLLDDTANFGDISAYATMRNTATPFLVELDASAPNNHQVNFTLDITANGGAYSTAAAFSFLVQRGIELPGPLFPAVITQSMTLHNDYLYIVKQNMLVAEGVTLTIEPGTRLQYDPGKFIKVQGTLIASGTAELPIVFTSNQKNPQPGDFQGIIFDDLAVDATLNPIPVTTTLVAEGDEIPGIGTVVVISGTPRFDSIGDVYFSAIISGTPNYEQVLQWYNGVGLIEASNDPLPDGATTTPFSETVSLEDPGSGNQVVFARPSEEYVSGNILNYVILEYGGGLLIDDSFPYVANSTFRQSKGILPTGASGDPLGVMVIQRPIGTDSHNLIIRNNAIVDNPNRGLFLQQEAGAGKEGRLTFSDNTVSNNRLLPNSYIGAGLYIVALVPTQIRGNLIQYNRATNCAAMVISGFEVGRLRLEANTVRDNAAYDDQGWEWTGSSVCVRSPALVRGNTWVGNIDQQGYQPGSSVARGGGSALNAEGSAPVVQFNTLIGNRAIPGNRERTAPGNTLLFFHQPSGPPARLNRNNILGNQASFDLYLSNFDNARKDMDATWNYWGTNDSNEIRYHRIYDYWQDFEPGEATFQPFLTAPEPHAPGFLFNATTTPPSPIGPETMTVTLDFSRDMNTAITPTVTFGVDEPYTQHAIEGGQWVSPTRWVGVFDVTVDTGDGINVLKVSEARDSGGMRIPEDTRFSFVIQTAGTQSILLEAAASVSQVALTWVQNDVADLAGYILYRSAYTNTGYTQIGGGMFVGTAYTDTAVTNGVTYYYKYSVLDTDFNEVAWSNEVSVTPDDATPPTTPAVTDDGATTPYFDRLHASWASADPETGIVEYQVCVGTAFGACDTVSWTALGLTTEHTWTGLNLADGVTYYINVRARNGADHWSVVGTSNGLTVDKLPAPVITAVAPVTGVRNIAHVITLTGSGFQASPAPTVRLGNTALGGVSVVNAAHLTAQVPAGIAAGVYTVTVTNFDTQVGALPRAYTATNPAVGPRPLLFSPTPRLLGDDESSTTVDVVVQDVSDLAAFQFDVLYDPAVVHVSDVTLGWFLGSGGRNTAALGPQIDNVNGRATFGGISYNTAPGAEGSGTLATLTFTPQTTGTTDLTLTGVQLRDSLNGEIPAALQPGQIWVVQYPFGDLDRDCDVDVSDIMQVASRWNDPATYDAAYDFDADGDIDVADIMQVAVAWGDVCVGGPLMAQPSQARSGPTLRLTGPTSGALQAGDEFTVSLQVEDAVDLAAYQLELAYDPAHLAVVDVSYTDLLSLGGNTTQTLGPAVDATRGRLTLAGFGYGGARGMDGNGALATVRMRALVAGPHSLSPVAALLVNQDAELVTPAAVLGWTSRGATLYLPLVTRAH